MSFVPHTSAERDAMLQAIGVASLDDLFADIPAALHLKRLNMPDGISELEVFECLAAMASRNRRDLTCFLGGGLYDHFIPAAVDSLASRGEFFTAYTPYQPEVAQGTLQAIFEYQSMICRLTGLDAANASLYDGGTALMESVLVAVNSTRRSRVIVSGSVNPLYLRILRSHVRNIDLEIVELPRRIGQPLDRQVLAGLLDESVAAVVVQNPDFFGTVEDFSDVAEMAHAAGALLLASVYPVSLGLLKSPAAMGVDIATGEGQSLGLPLSFGGPYLGFFATRQKHVRKMPGRVVGESVDRHGNRCYVLTLQAREQHIRREKATSNICTNQALCALRATIHLSLLGRNGLREVAEACLRKADYAKRRLSAVKGLRVLNHGPTFNEFVVELPRSADSVVSDLIGRGLVAGLPLGRFYPEAANALLISFTEKLSQARIDSLVTALEESL